MLVTSLPRPQVLGLQHTTKSSSAVFATKGTGRIRGGTPYGGNRKAWGYVDAGHYGHLHGIWRLGVGNRLLRKAADGVGQMEVQLRQG